MEFEEIVKIRYATKEFTGKKVSEEDLNRLLEMIRLAPSSYNIQPWKIIVISDEKIKEKLSPVAYNQPQIKSCSHLLVFCANTDLKEIINDIEKGLLESGKKPEQIKGYINTLRDFEKSLTNDKKLSWAQRQLYLALSNAVNGAKSLGFDSGPMEGFNSEEFSKILELSENIVPTALCAIGYAKEFENKGPKFRLKKEDIFEFKN